MKIRKLVSVLALAGAIIPTAAQAALSLELGQWSIVNGAISTNSSTECPAATAGGTCQFTTLAQGDGFLQQEIRVSQGGILDGTYIRTIVTDPIAAGTNVVKSAIGGLPYSDESIVMSGGLSSGILSRQLQSDTASSGFKSSSELAMGWAGDANGNSSVTIGQSFTDTGLPGTSFVGDTFSNDFNLKVVLDDTGTEVGKSMSIDQVLEMGDYQSDNTTDIQRFVVEQRTGAELASAGFVGLNQVYDGDGLLVIPHASGTNGVVSIDGNGVIQNTNPTDGAAGAGNAITTASDYVDWAANTDDVMLVWLGQKVKNGTGVDDFATFGFQRATNQTDPNAVVEAMASSTTSTVVTQEPFDWNALFNNDYDNDGTTAPTAPFLPTIP